MASVVAADDRGGFPAEVEPLPTSVGAGVANVAFGFHRSLGGCPRRVAALPAFVAPAKVPTARMIQRGHSVLPGTASASAGVWITVNGPNAESSASHETGARSARNASPSGTAANQ